MSEPATFEFQAEVSQVLRLVIQSLYSHKEIFLRELISNASDALDKLRFNALSDPDLVGGDTRYRVRVIPDKAAKTLTIEDNGIGMNREELARSLGTIAWSGSRDFLQKLADVQEAAQSKPELIGQFGVGFYSAYLVADEVEVVSRAAGQNDAFRWRSKGENTFTIEPAEREERGTTVILHLKADQLEYLEEFKLRGLIKRYSDYLAHPIELAMEKEGKRDFETVNQAAALWQRPAKEVSKEQYEEFYKHLTHDWEPPLAWKHFRIEGTQLFAGLLFIPSRAPFDLFEADPQHGVRLHVRRVFIMENCEELVPRWLRFVRGVIDSEDLPLNVSRELLQDSRAVRIIRKQVVAQTLDALDDLAQNRPEDYATFWRAFGAVLKEGIHFEADQKERISKLLRYEGSASSGLISLDQYLEEMKPDQPAIYYAAGMSREVLEQSPHTEALRQRGYQILFLTDAVDPFVVESLGKYQDKPFESVMDAKLDLKPQEDEEAKPENADKVLARFKEILGERVSDVQASQRLAESPVCLVVPQGGMAPHIERMLRARQAELPASRRVLEVNLTHPLVQKLAKLQDQDAEAQQLQDYVEVLYDQALLAEGSPIDNPAAFARRLSQLLTDAAGK